MANGKLVFTQIIQDSRDLGGAGEHMVSRVFFHLELEDRALNGKLALCWTR